MTPKKPAPAKKSAAQEKAKGTAKAAKPTAPKPPKTAKPPAPRKAQAPKPKPDAKAASKAPAVKAATKAAAKGAAKEVAKDVAKGPTKGPASKSKAVAKPAPKAAAKSAAPAPAAKAAAAPTAVKGKSSSVSKILGKKIGGKGLTGSSGKGPAKPAKVAPPPPPKPLSNKEKLAKLLAMRAADTKAKSREAAEELRKGTGSTVPSSVHKAAEFAETRKISSIVKSGKRTSREASPAVPQKKVKKRKLPYSKAELRELKDILESERTRLLRDLAVMNDVATSSEENMSRSFSNHQADAATDSSALETTFVTRRYEEERLSQVTRALERLESGTYGLCEMCAEEPLKKCESCPFIPIGRLRAKPFAILCLPCRQDLEKKNRR